jgi:putative ABC transport system permease protein
MIFEHIKIGFRHLIKDKFYTFLNFTGLCIGIIIALFIATWVIDELNYDNYFGDSDRIYRVERDFNYNGRAREMPVTSFNYAKALANTFPEIVATTKMYPYEVYMNDPHNIFRKEMVHFADSNFFEIFNFNLISGNPLTALDNPNSVVLTQKSAQKLFGDTQVLGKTVQVKIENLQYSLKVTGIIDRVPQNTHFHPEIIVPLPLLREYLERVYDEWRVNVGYTYIKIDDTKNLEKIQSQLPEFMLQYVDPAYRTMLQDDDDINDAIVAKLKNIEDIHLKSHLEYELETNGDIKTVYLLSSIAILIVLLAVINYVNLTNARSEIRSLEVGIRKVVGSTKTQLARHFFTESFILILVAFLVSITFMFLLSDLYQNISGKEFHWVFFKSFNYTAILLGGFVVISILAGLYPAVFVSGFNILKSLKGKKQPQSQNISSKASLVIFQFVISIGLITFSLLMALQIKLIHSKDIGFNKDNLLVIEVDNPNVREQYNSFKDELKSLSNVQEITSAGVVPINQIYPSLTVKKPEATDDIFFAYIGVNYDYFKTFEIELLSGRLFSEQFSDTSAMRYVINEKASQQLGFANPDEAIGQFVETKSRLVSTYDKGEIIGVVKNFNIKSLHNNIEPAGMVLFPNYLNAIFVRINPKQIGRTVQEIQSIWQKRYPESEFNYYFLADAIDKQYESEKGLQSKILLSTLLAIVIGCMGLLGLSVYILQQRTKEIGVRKVNGATVNNLVFLFSKQYIKWISISALIVCPVSFFLFKNWLNNFAIKININYFWGIFIIAWLAITLISLVTVIGQTIKYARLNPVDVLKYE